MDNYLYDTIKRYFTTLSAMGSIKKSEKYALFVASSVFNVYKTFQNIISPEDTIKFNEYLHCLAKSHPCIFKKFMPELTYDAAINSLITIIDKDIIATQSGAITVSQNRKTQEFPDFEARTDLQIDNYVVGYDESDRKEVRFNVVDLGVFWEVDL